MAGLASVGLSACESPSTAAAAQTNTPSAGGTTPASLGNGGEPHTLAEIADLAKQCGGGEPICMVDLAAVDRNCDLLLNWSQQNNITWRPAYKTLQSAELLAYVVRKLDSPRVMIHHLKNLQMSLDFLPDGTDYLMGYPPTVGELKAYLDGRYAPMDGNFRLRVNVDSLDLMRELVAMLPSAVRPLPLEVVIEIDSGSPRGGLQPGDELSEAIQLVRSTNGDLVITGLLCYDALGAADSNQALRAIVAQLTRNEFKSAYEQLEAEASDIVDIDNLVRNGPGSANYQNWTGTTEANEFSAGSAVVFADYLDDYDSAGLIKALYACAPVLRLPTRLIAGLPFDPADLNLQLTFIKAGGWPTGNNPTLSKLAYPEGLQEAPPYGRGANSSGLVLSPTGSLGLGDYVVETFQQVMEGQNYFDTTVAIREFKRLADWSNVPLWGA